MVFRGQDLWRAAPIFKYGVFDVLPGIREGLALFVIYLGYEYVTTRGGGGHGHAAAGHGGHAGHGAAAAGDAHAHDAHAHDAHAAPATAAAAYGHGGGHHAGAATAKLH
jgi:hypothetical protein